MGNRRSFLRNIGLGAAAFAVSKSVFADGGASVSSQKPARTQTHPNIIYILADDLGYGDLSCQNENSKIQTPNMDRLASQGIRFTDAHSNSSVCTPTRYGVLTGRYAWRSALKKGVLWGGSPALVEPGRMTVASLLKENSYSTACFGKWHLGMDWERLPEEKTDRSWPENGRDIDFAKPFRGGPTDTGFDTFYGIHGSLDMPPYVWIKDDRALDIPQAMTREGGRNGRTAEGFKAVDVMPNLTKAVVEYIEERVESKKGNPFFVYFPLTAPHTPIVPDKQFLGKSGAGKYGDFVVECDWTVGRVTEAVERLGIADNTLIILTSDNGPETLMWSRKEEYGHDSAYDFRGCKRDNWDGGHRIPFIARWPGKIRPGTTNSEIICLTDLMATAAGIVGKSLPSGAGEDSYDILPALFGAKMLRPIREATVHHSYNGEFAIRQGKWKLLLHPGSGGNRYDKGPNAIPEDAPEIQLYDIARDFSETKNVYKEHPEVVEKLTTLLEQYKKEGRSARRI